MQLTCGQWDGSKSSVCNLRIKAGGKGGALPSPSLPFWLEHRAVGRHLGSHERGYISQTSPEKQNRWDVCVYTYTHICKYTYVYRSMCVYMCIHTHIVTYILAYILYIYLYILIDTHVDIKRCIIRNWLMQLWRLTNPRICSQRAGAPREVRCQAESAGLRTRRADGVILVQRLASSRPRKSQCFGSGLKAGKCPSTKAVRQADGRNSPLLQGRSVFCS